MFSEGVGHMGVRPTQCVSFGPPIMVLFGPWCSGGHWLRSLVVHGEGSGCCPAEVLDGSMMVPACRGISLWVAVLM